MGSIASSDHMEHICKNLEYAKQLITINFSGNNFSVNTCRIMGNFMTASYSLRDVDIAHCRISYQGTRYIIDALNRNTYIR
jgi:Ran GTPase-activating protein (RanGAP) involved in mRNA processing and transport